MTVSAPSAKVTIAVVSWNTRDLLAECLTSMHDDVRASLADVWVVDNASSDASAAMVKARFPWVHVISSEVNLGFGAAVNLVAERTQSDWLAPANADIRLGPDALRTLVQAGAEHPKAGALAPRLILPDGTTQRSVYPFPTLGFTVAQALGIAERNTKLARRWCLERGFDQDRAREVPWAVGAFLLIRSEAWRAAGGFSPHQWMYAEDLDLGWRVSRAGFSTWYIPEAHVHHAESASTRQAWGEERHYRWHVSTYAWLLRRRGGLIARTIALVNVTGFVLKAIGSQLGAHSEGASRAQQRQSALAAARLHTVGLRPRRRLES